MVPFVLLIQLDKYLIIVLYCP